MLAQKILKEIPDHIKAFARIFRGGKHSSPLDVERAEEIFYINYLREGMTVYDVGANIGEMTLLFSRFIGQAGHVHAFEASSETFKKLDTIISFAHRKNVTLNQLALADKNGTVTLTVYPDEYASWNSLADRPLESYGIQVKPIRFDEVVCSTVDNYSLSHAIRYIDLLKIDVEGAEYQVLLGAQKMLQEKRVGYCVFEYGGTTFDMGNTPEMIEGFLGRMGYSIENIVSGAKNFPGREGAKFAQFSIHIAKPKKP